MSRTGERPNVIPTGRSLSSCGKRLRRIWEPSWRNLHQDGKTGCDGAPQGRGVIIPSFRLRRRPGFCWVYPGFPTPFWGLSGFCVGDSMGKSLWKLVENTQRFPKARWARSVRPRCRQLPQGQSVCRQDDSQGGGGPPRPRTAVDR